MEYAAIINETAAELTETENKQKLVQFQKRIRFLWLLKSGTAKTQLQAGAQVGWKLRQSQKIWRLYRESGVSGVLHKNVRWQSGKLSKQQQAQLNEQLAASNGASSLAAVQNHLQSAFGARYSLSGVSVLCQRLKIKLKTARPSNLKKDEAKAIAYKKTLLS